MRPRRRRPPSASGCTAEAAVAIAFALVVMLVPYWGPVVAYAVSPVRAAPLLKRLSEWILGHTRPLEIWVGLLFGAGFLSKGVQGLS